MAQPPKNAGGLIGQRLDEYELVALLALGGAAEIYLARHAGVAGFEKYVVVKCLHDHLADDSDYVKMFLDEARLGARLDHSNIVQTLKLGSQNGRYYMAMEFLAGVSLSFVVRKAAERVPGGRLPVDLALNLMIQACSGLHYAHNRTDADGKPLDVVHRDVSPQNLVISFEGVLKLVDFGIAKATVRDTKTQSGTIKGKFAYMAPEQCLGKKVDRRTDVFALGAITHELLTGRRLFKREANYDTYHAVLDCNVAPPSQLNTELDPALDPVILKAVAKDPDDRYATAEDYGDALVALLHKHGRSVSHGAVARFFEEYFAIEIDEHGQRMRELISGRQATVDEHWGDDLQSEVALEALGTPPPARDTGAAGPATPALPGTRDGVMVTSELSIGDAAVMLQDADGAGHQGDQDSGDGEGHDDGATRIELNPLEQAQLTHGQLTGQVAALSGLGAGAPAAEPAREPAAIDMSRRRTLLAFGAPSAPPPATAEEAAGSPPPSGAGLHASGPPAAAPLPIDDAAADAQTLLADDQNAAMIAQAVAQMNAPNAPRAPNGPNAPAAPPAAEGFPHAADMRTQIAPSDSQPVAGRSGPVAPLRSPGPGFPGAADLRTQIAPADEPHGRSASGPYPPAPSHPVHFEPQQPVMPERSDGAGAAPLEPRYPVSSQTDRLAARARGWSSPRAESAQRRTLWFLALVFVAAVGLGLGATLLTARLL